MATARSAPASTRVLTPSATPSSAWTCAALPTAIARAAVACVKRKRSVLSVESPRKPPSARLFSPVAWLYTPVAVLNWPVALLETPSAIAPKAVPCELLPRASDQEPLAFERTPIAIRSEERRVGKECLGTCRSRWLPYHSTTKNNKHHTYNYP